MSDRVYLEYSDDFVLLCKSCIGSSAVTGRKNNVAGCDRFMSYNTGLGVNLGSGRLPIFV